MPSFTTQKPDLTENGPTTNIELAISSGLEKSMKESGDEIPTPVSGMAMIDTGASVTVISDNLIKKLNINPTGKVLVNTPTAMNVSCDEYHLRVIFPNNVIIETFVVSAPMEGQNVNCLIGRDLLQHSVFVYIGYARTFSLSF